MKKNKALINYYARLVRKGRYLEKDLPPELKEDIMAKVAELPPTTVDPDTQAPS